MRGSVPPDSVWLMKRKLKASIIACRTRQSAKTGLREFITRPMIPEGRAFGISDFTTRPSRTAGKVKSRSQRAAINSRQTSVSPALKASNMVELSPK